MERYTLVRFAGKLTSCARNAHSKSQHTSGAMERYTWVRFAGKLTSCQTTHIAMVSISVGRWRKHLGRFKMQALTGCNANVMSTRTTVGQFKCQFKGAMEEMRQKVQNASTHILRRKNTSTHTTAGQCKGQSKGAMDESSGQGQKASTRKKPCCHGYRSLQN